LGKKTAEDLTSFIVEKVKEEVDTKTMILATKQDIADVRVNASANKAELIKWMFLFWIGQVAVTFGFILLFLKK
jgi:hypothetical protein